ncbi:MAG: hypothetical protein WBO36_01805 [Saprospiraceae bacterium]
MLLGLSATLPIMISTKQSGIYLIPGLPMFALAAAIWILPSIKNLAESQWYQKKQNYFRHLSAILMAGILIYSISIFGTTRREANLIHDIELLQNIIPAGSTLGVCDAMMEDFVMHTYMQRMGKYILVKNQEKPVFLLENKDCYRLTQILETNGYHEVENLDLEYLKLLTKQ